MTVDDPPETTVNNVTASPQTKECNTYVFVYILLISCEFLSYHQLYSYILILLSQSPIVQTTLNFNDLIISIFFFF